MFRVPDDTALTFQRNLIISNTSIGTARPKLAGAFINNDTVHHFCHTPRMTEVVFSLRKKRRGWGNGESVRRSIYLVDLKEQTVWINPQNSVLQFRHFSSSSVCFPITAEPQGWNTITPRQLTRKGLLPRLFVVS
jgi:hypothetical protein